MKINYLIGDATSPQKEGYKIIAHICNDIGAWGKGFVLALSNKWQEPENEYLRWYQEGKDFALGEIQLVQVEPKVTVANMIAQRDVLPDSNRTPPIRYEYLRGCLKKLATVAKEKNSSIHMPRIGTGLAGGKWNTIEDIISNTLLAANIPVYVYDLKQPYCHKASFKVQDVK